ncbi:hypothetical protein B0H14DRAFT_2611892 [Mycena olivaceomarginata]|nr:hypothetical protein B0H14DRAFT_2611892 [Mycena olivaceomarginata]
MSMRSDGQTTSPDVFAGWSSRTYLVGHAGVHVHRSGMERVGGIILMGNPVFQGNSSHHTELISEGPTGPDRFGAASARAEVPIGDILSGSDGDVGRRPDDHEMDEDSCDGGQAATEREAQERGSEPQQPLSRGPREPGSHELHRRECWGPRTWQEGPARFTLQGEH